MRHPGVQNRLCPQVHSRTPRAPPAAPAKLPASLIHHILFPVVDPVRDRILAMAQRSLPPAALRALPTAPSVCALLHSARTRSPRGFAQRQAPRADRCAPCELPAPFMAPCHRAPTAAIQREISRGCSPGRLCAPRWPGNMGVDDSGSDGNAGAASGTLVIGALLRASGRGGS